ncbi:MAG: hypothetical protein WC850_05550 [Candidatus Gracilibacteria bacterium]
MQNNNKKAFSLIIAMFLMIITNLLALYLLEYIIPFSRNTKGMENGTKAYYEANKGIEDVLFSMKKEDAYFETGNTMTGSNLGYYYSLTSTGKTIPLLGDGTSEFGSGYNKISISNPVQLLLKGVINWSNVKFYFKVPQFDGSTSTPIVFTGGAATTDPIINWQLSSDTETLNSSGSQIMYSDICDSQLGTCFSPYYYNISGKQGYTLAGTGESFETFYNDASNNCFNSGCILKLSIVNELLTNDSRKIPYLEYKIDFDSTNVANYYAIIRTSGKSTGYRKDLKLYIPQQTTIEAFDFTVFQ